jgi:hypothetical protein
MAHTPHHLFRSVCSKCVLFIELCVINFDVRYPHPVYGIFLSINLDISVREVMLWRVVHLLRAIMVYCSFQVAIVSPKFWYLHFVFESFKVMEVSITLKSPLEQEIRKSIESMILFKAFERT